MHLRPLTLRWRLTLWYTTVLGATLLIFGAFLYTLLATHLYAVVDEELNRQSQHLTGTIAVESDLPSPPRLTAREQGLLGAFASPSVVTLFFDGRGEVLASTADMPSIGPLQRAAARSLEDGPVILTVNEPLPRRADGIRTRWRVRVQALDGQAEPTGGLDSDPSRQIYLQVASDLSQITATLNRFSLWVTLVGLSALILAGFVVWLLAERALAPIAMMTETARAIAAGRGFHRRLEHPGRDDELGRLAITFNEMLASLAEAYEAQQRFVADASHELRAPLATVRGNLRLMGRRNQLSPSEVDEIIEDAHLEVERMSQLISDLLELARADAGGEMIRTEVELERLVLETYRSYERRPSPPTLALTKLEPIKVMGDATLLRRLLVIFLENAYRYAPEGRIELSLERTGDWARVKVRDTGIGIAHADIPHIFERFFRADKARSRSQGGTGLGLSIAKWIVDGHGGNVEVDSTPGAGTTFAVLLPVAG